MGVGGFVEQGYASLMMGCGACVADCWMSRLVVVGPPWRVSLDNPSCRTFNREPASNGNSSTIATAREQCQTQIPRMLQQCFNLEETGETMEVSTQELWRTTHGGLGGCELAKPRALAGANARRSE